ncbi:MAG: alpha-L-fucosidase [Acidimicrobiia bacterium]
MAPRDPVLRALRRHVVPAWWRDAKLGIFVHWTPASVPAFAPVEDDVTAMVQSGDRRAMGWSPYTEWYENSLRFPDSPVARHHRATYGDREYRTFAPEWEAGLESWDPDDWAARFVAAGARYVVLVTKHHDGYCLWPTDVANPHLPGWHCRRDVVGELGEAVRARGMRFGVYYSGGLDWTFEDRPIGAMSDLIAAIPRGDYPAYAAAHVRELVARYRPSVLWNDIAWPSEGRHLWPVLRDYYAAVPDGVINDRWMPWNPLAAAMRFGPARKAVDAGTTRQSRKDAGLIPPEPPFYDVRTPEYVSFPTIQRRPWECVRGMDHSFGYNAQSRPEDFLPRGDLLWSFADMVSKNGNLLLNVGPRGVDAQIPPEQALRLEWLGAWMVEHEPAVRGTRPWVRADGTTVEGSSIRYTARDRDVFAIVESRTDVMTFPDLVATPTTHVADVAGRERHWSATGAGLRVELGPQETTADSPVALRCTDVAASRVVPGPGAT